MSAAVNEIFVAAPARTIYELAAATERWPQILPHYRYVRVLSENGAQRTVEMAAWRGAIPIRWTAAQTNDRLAPRIVFHHMRGWTTGMDVAWTFHEDSRGTLVRIEHALAFRFPVASEWLGQHVVCDYFVHDVAAKTLACMKRLAEAA